MDIKAGIAFKVTFPTFDMVEYEVLFLFLILNRSRSRGEGKGTRTRQDTVLAQICRQSSSFSLKYTFRTWSHREHALEP